MNNFSKWVDIQCFKHDGKLHREWDRGFVVYDDEEYIAIAAKRAKVVENNGRKWFTKEPAVTIFSKKHWFNAICMFKEDGICYYVNIASPSIIDRKTIKYIDYDLDWKLYPDGQIRLLDESEYASNKRKYKYSDELHEVLLYETERVKKMMKEKEFPFDDKRIRDLYNIYLNKVSKEEK